MTKSPTDTDNWEAFIEAFETVFHRDWTESHSRLSSLDQGTFLQPEPRQTTSTWENRDRLLAAYHRIKPEIELAIIEVQKFREETAKYETWMTGEVSTGLNGLLFRADKPIDGNSTGSVVLLGAKLGLENVLLPVYVKAAKVKAALRLYGVLIPTQFVLPAYDASNAETPSVTFITWKCHSPEDPNELPESALVGITPEDRFSGYRVQLVRDSSNESLMETVLHEFERLQHHPRSCVVVMNGFIELLVNTLVEEKCKSGKKLTENNRDYPHSVKLTMLFELGLLVEDEFQKLNWFRKLRNEAAHKAIFTITPNSLQLFAGTKYADVSHFPLLCMDIFRSLWNKYANLFSSKFSPKGLEGIIVTEDIKGRTFTMPGVESAGEPMGDAINQASPQTTPSPPQA